MTARRLLMDLWLLPQWRRLVRARWDERSRFGILLFAFLSFLGILYGIFKPILRNFATAELVGSLLVAKLVYVFLTILLVVLLLSNVVSMLGRFILDDESEALMSAPLDPAALFRFRFWQAGLGSGWMVLPLWLPLVFALRKALGTGLEFVAWSILPLLPLGLLASSASCLFLFLVLRAVPAGLLRRALAVAGAAFGCALVVLLRLIQPEKLANPESAKTVSGFLQQLQIPEPWFNPATHAAVAVSGWLQDPGQALLPLAGLCLAAALAWWITAWYAAPRFHGLWLKAREMESKGRDAGGTQAASSTRWFRSGGSLRVLVTRQFLSIVRHPSHRVQVLFLGVLVLIFLYSIYSIKWDDSLDLRGTIFNLACFFSQLIVLAVGARFFFPGPSLDSRSNWIEIASPVARGSHLWSRYLPALAVLLALSLVLAWISALLVEPGGRSLASGLFIAATSPLLITSLVVGLGIAWASPDFKQPDHAVTSSAGVMMTVGAFLAVAANVGIAAWFRYALYHAGLVKAARADYTAVVVSGLFWVAIFVSAMVVPLVMARRRLRHWDF